MGANSGMANSYSGATQLLIAGAGSYGEECYISQGDNYAGHGSPTTNLHVFWGGEAGYNNPMVSCTVTVYYLSS